MDTDARGGSWRLVGLRGVREHEVTGEEDDAGEVS